MTDNLTLDSVVARSERLRFTELQAVNSLKFWWRPTVRILVVTDASGSFDSAADFGLGRALDEVRHDPWWWVRFEIVTAHRGIGAADHSNFNFASPPAGAGLSTFDQIWLFGVASGGDISAAEVSALRAFMDGGGGVFATGDHEALGAAISANLPRVNEMRQWRAGGSAGTPPFATGPNRHETLRSGADAIYEFDDQSDNTPQRISPKRYYDPWSFSPIKARWRPHPVLCGRHGILRTLPDHMHEGNCVVPSAAQVGADPATWPGGVAPEIIATATVIGHVAADFGPVNARQFGVLSAYDGHLADVGRIVCDATWHHWFNVNLVGFDTTSAHYDEIRNYFWNVALWLAPPAKQRAMFNAAVYGLRYFQPFNELVVGNTPIWVLGLAGIDAIGRRASQCTATEWIFPHLPPKLIKPLIRRPIPEPDPILEGLGHVREFVIGGALASVLAATEVRHADEEPLGEDELDKLVSEGVANGLAELATFERDLLARQQRTLKVLDGVVEKANHRLATSR